MSFDRPLLNSDSSEQELAKILDELNAYPVVMPPVSNREPCWLESEEFGSALMDYRGASPHNAHQAFLTLLSLIRANVGRIRA